MARMTKTEKIKNIELEIVELENQRKQLLATQKEDDRKARTKRLCERAGILESLLPDTVKLSGDAFKMFLEKTVANDFGRRTLAKLLAEHSPANYETAKLPLQNAKTETPSTAQNAATAAN